jgi:hypothetical protein
MASYDMQRSYFSALEMIWVLARGSSFQAARKWGMTQRLSSVPHCAWLRRSYEIMQHATQEPRNTAERAGVEGGHQLALWRLFWAANPQNPKSTPVARPPPGSGSRSAKSGNQKFTAYRRSDPLPVRPAVRISPCARAWRLAGPRPWQQPRSPVAVARRVAPFDFRRFSAGRPAARTTYYVLLLREALFWLV